MNSDARSAHDKPVPGSTVTDAAGQQAKVTSCEQAQDSFDVILQLATGTALRLPAEMLAPADEGNYRLPYSFAAIADAAPAPGEKTDGVSHVIPVIEEQLQIGKRVVETGRGIRVQQHIVEREEVVDEPLYEDVFEVTRVPVDRVVTDGAVPSPRQDGETFVVPVLEEVLVVEKRLRVKEELRITRHKRETHAPQTVMLKSQQVSIERFDEKREMGGTTT